MLNLKTSYLLIVAFVSSVNAKPHLIMTNIRYWTRGNRSLGAEAKTLIKQIKNDKWHLITMVSKLCKNSKFKSIYQSVERKTRYNKKQVVGEVPILKLCVKSKSY